MMMENDELVWFVFSFLIVSFFGCVEGKGKRKTIEHKTFFFVTHRTMCTGFGTFMKVLPRRG
jgi:hypothetical protein